MAEEPFSSSIFNLRLVPATLASVSTAYFTHQLFRNHDNGPRHPERPARLDAVEAAIQAHTWHTRLLRPEFAAADDLALLRCHPQAHIDLIRDMAAAGGGVVDGDTNVSPASFEAAALAAGAAMAAVDTVMDGTCQNAFVAARPPGHHAETSRAMGFCLFNNVAIAARHAQTVHNLSRVAILDWDVHHGNGTQDIFYQDPSVLFASVHEAGIYPGTGDRHERGSSLGTGTTLNFPLPPGSDGAVYADVWNRLGHEVDAFAPELIIVSAGFDAHSRDPLAHMELQASDFAHLARQTKEWAEHLCDGRLICVLEGGYDLEGLSTSAAAVVEVLLIA